MARFDFDRVTDRKNTNSLKFDFAVENGLPEDVLPMWIADMDFPAPEGVLEVLHRCVDHGIFGYSGTKDDYFEAVAEWFSAHFGWTPEKAWLVKTPGVVFALAAAVRAFTAPGDAVLIQPPVYGPFFNVVRQNGRVLVESPLVLENGHYDIDFQDFEAKIIQNGVKLFILCSPHNPIGRVWTAGELARLGDVCARHGVFVVSDEIHCDFAFPEHPHTVFFQAAPALLERSIVCTAPSKSFNLAGLHTSNIWIPGEASRAAFQQELARTGCGEPNLMGLRACQAAYETGGEWQTACKAYLRENLDFLREYLRRYLPQIRLMEPEGTYFAWLDCGGLGMTDKALNDFIIHKAKLWLDAGNIFGKTGEQFQRMVLACPRATLREALDRLRRAVEAI